jgi:hypothetical protein
MINCDMKVTGKKLVITVDLGKTHGTSKSGNSTIIASTQGNQSVPGTDDVKIGLNIYKPV